MPERFNFDADVWADQRRAIRATGKWSVWYRTIYALTYLLQDRAERAEWLRDQIWLDSSSEYGLTLWGQRYEIARYYGESDDDYRTRLYSERMIARGDASNSSRKKILNIVYGIDPKLIRVERIYDHHLTMGGVSDRGNEEGYEGGIGSPIASRDYAMHVYRIYAPLPENHEDKIMKVQRMFHDINIGGNVWELWFEGEVQSGIQTQDEDRALDRSSTSSIRKYTIY